VRKRGRLYISIKHRVNMGNRVNNMVTRHNRGKDIGRHITVADAGTNAGADARKDTGGGGAFNSGDPVTAGEEASAEAGLDAGAGRPL
jgi:hypothetical protein